MNRPKPFISEKSLEHEQSFSQVKPSTQENSPSQNSEVTSSWESFLMGSNINITRAETPYIESIQESPATADQINKLTEFLFKSGSPQEPVEATGSISFGNVHKEETMVQTTPDLRKETLLDYIDFGLLFSEMGSFAKKGRGSVKEFGFAVAEVFSIALFGWKEKKRPETPQEQAEEVRKMRQKSKIQRFFDSLVNFTPFESKLRIKNKALETNQQFGINTSYEGILNSDGSMRTDVETFVAMENSKKTQEQIRAEKRKRMAAVINKGKKGPGVIFDLNKAAESQSNVVNLKG